MSESSSSDAERPRARGSRAVGYMLACLVVVLIGLLLVGGVIAAASWVWSLLTG